MSTLTPNHPARIAREAEQARREFWKTVLRKSEDCGTAPTCEGLSNFTTVGYVSLYNYKAGRREMGLTTLQEICRNLAPDIRVVLRFLGYSDKEITRFAKEASTP